jgi:serine/threonine protein kinase
MNILRSMDHPNIIKLFEIIEDDSKYYFVTEL